jgi:hypothetical protein
MQFGMDVMTGDDSKPILPTFGNTNVTNAPSHDMG